MSPDGSTNPPPEEKLLRLIRSKAKVPAGGSAVSAPAGRPAAGPMPMHASQAVRPQRWGLKLTIGILAAALGLEAMLLAARLASPLPAIAVPAVGTGSEPVAVEPGGELDGLPSLAQVASPELFISSAPQGASEPSTVASSATAKLVAGRLSLLGIMAGNPGQAIIEDSQTKKSYFVSPGQPVVEGAVVDQVLEDRVILNLAGEHIELSL